MINVSNNGIVQLIRGDYAELHIFLNAGSNLYPQEYPITDGTVFYFGICEPHQPFENAIVRKRYTKENVDEEGYLKVVLESSDTEFLHEGKYYYSLKAVNEDNNVERVNTIIAKTLFYII